MELIVIANPSPLNLEAQLINQLFEAGLARFHLRKPDASNKTIEGLLNDINPAFYPKIVLHQRHEMAANYGIKRLHYPENKRKQLQVNQLKNQIENGYILSSSVHNLTLLPSLSNFYYVFFSPVFNSLSKPNYKGTITENFKLEKQANWPKVIALGGIEYTNIAGIKQMGFDGAALLGWIWGGTRK